MTRLLALRLIVWMLPAAIALVLVPRRRTGPVVAAVLLGIVWNAWSLLAVNAVATQAGWWSFHPGGPAFMGVSLEPLLGWAILWGTVPLLVPDRPVILLVAGIVWVDLIAMPLMDPLVVLGDTWLFGEAVSLLICFVPGALLARWTLQGRRLSARISLQIVATAALSLWLVPHAAFAASGGWGSILELPGWWLLVVVQVLAFPAVVAVRAALEFAERGRGTPIPYDPPRRLVTSGPYAYVRNPMQVGMVLVFLLGGVMLWNVWLVFAAGIGFCYSAGLAAWHEGDQLSQRFGPAWSDYRGSIRPWLPRWRPLSQEPSTLLVAYSCGICSSIGRWFLERDPIGLTIAPAEESDDPNLLRVTYASPDGARKRGVVAIAHALEHINLGWAFVGWILALPVVSHFAQVLVDVFGPAPRRVAGRAYDPAACATAIGPR